MEVTNRFKGLDLLDRVPEQLWWEVHNIVQEVVTKIIPKGKKKMQEGKVVCLRRTYKQPKEEEKQKARRKGEIYQLHAE